MRFGVVAGGRPDKTREEFMVRNGDNNRMVSSSYITKHQRNLSYLGTVQVNSVIIHTYSPKG